MKKQHPQCAKCSVIRCSLKDQNKNVPSYCPTENYPDLLKDSVEKMNLPENLAVNKGWLGYFSEVVNPEKFGEKYAWTRVDEIIAYAKVRGMEKIGIATCYVLMSESKSLTEILENNGFTVVSVCCLCGETNPRDIGMPGNICCNPILQAEILNREETALNIMMGLCLGHDILFLRYAKAETTPLIVKDRALGHNPVAALYQNQNPFYKDRFKKK